MMEEYQQKQQQATSSSTLFAGFSILVLVAMSTISHYYKPTNNNLYEEQQESRLLAQQVEQDEGTTIIPEITQPEENRQIDVDKDPATIGIVVIIATTVAAVSILCNLLVIFLTSRKKEINEESLHPRIYQRIMCSLAVTAIVVEVNYFVAGISGSMFNVMRLKSQFQGDDIKIITKANESISFGCFMQAFLDMYFYIAYMFCCVWLCLYFLLKLNHGIARLSKCAEVSAYLVIFLLAFGFYSFIMTNGTVIPNPSYGICSLIPQPVYYMAVPVLFGVIFLLGILLMLLIIYKTFRDEQEMNQVTSIEQGIQPSLGTFEATKDIAIQAFALVLFLFFGFFLQVFLWGKSGFVYEVITLMTYLSQGVYLLTLYLWFEMRNIQKQYPNMRKIDTFISIFNQDQDLVLERRYSQALSTEQTPLMVDRKRCVFDMTLVEDEMCEDLLRDLDEIDRKLGREKDEDDEEDEEMARRRQAKREEEERIQKLQEENMHMFGGAYISVKDRDDFQNIMSSHFDDMKQELADRKHKHKNSLRDSNVPVRLRYGSIDPSTFLKDLTEKEIDNLSADGTRDPSTMQPGELKLAEIKEEDEEEDGVAQKKRENAGSISSQDLSGLEEGDIDEDDEDYVGPPMQQPSGYTIISDLTSISTLRF